MALLGKNKTLSNFFNQGLLGDVTEGLGVGSVINFIDDRTGRHLKGVNVSLGKTVNAQPLNLNLTDAALILATTGLHLGGNNMMRFLITFGAKKLGEAFGVIMDDPLPTRTTLPQLTIGGGRQQLVMQQKGGNYQ